MSVNLGLAVLGQRMGWKMALRRDLRWLHDRGAVFAGYVLFALLPLALLPELCSQDNRTRSMRTFTSEVFLGKLENEQIRGNIINKNSEN